MLLLDSSNLSVYEVADEILSHRTKLPLPITHERFEATARSHFCSLFLAAQFPAFRVGAETLVFVQLAREGGWAWASRIRVAILDELPIAEAYIGDEFLFLWPVPMAINAYINFKEKARRLSNGEPSSDEFVNDIKAHPPSMTFVPQYIDKSGAIETLRQVRAKDMTTPQRLFVASLTPHSSAFSVRSPTDKWTEALRDKDQSQLRNFLQKRDPAPAAASCGAGPALRTRGRSRKRLPHGCVPFDLPDDVVERILSIHIAQNMECAEGMRLAMTRARLVSHQFRRMTNAAMERMLTLATKAAHSLLGSNPSEPSEVQTIVHAAGITLRQALQINPARWDYYLRLRQKLEQGDSSVPHLAPYNHARHRCAVLWGIASV